MLKCTEQDISLEVFQNKENMPEFAMQVVKDAKGNTFTPSKKSVTNQSRILGCLGKLIIDRPKHLLHERLEPQPLFWSPILMHLAMFIGKGAFRDYSTIDKFLEIDPPEEEMFHLE